MNDKPIQALGVNPTRLRADFDALAKIGWTGDGGVHRPALGEAHLAARRWLREQIDLAGLEFRTDGAGNHSAFLACGRPGAPALLLGSHLDSVPYGGRFDGPLGVLSALEALRVVKENHLALSMNLEAIDFTDEEGTLVGLLGSTALAGKLTQEHLANSRAGLETLQAALARAGLTEQGLLSAARSPETLGGYLELHIEQGSRLVNAAKDIGIVTLIVGISSFKLSFIGRADHAGTTPMQDRLDAAQGASAFTVAVREIVLRDFPHCVANVGKMEFSPAAFNIVPARVIVSLESRGPDDDELQRLSTALLERAQVEAKRFGLGLDVEFLGKHAPAPMSVQAQGAIAKACDLLRLSTVRLVSGAGHDAQSLAGSCPVGMIFVPSIGGFSHSSREFTEWQACVNGANVLLHAALTMAAGPGKA